MESICPLAESWLTYLDLDGFHQSVGRLFSCQVNLYRHVAQSFGLDTENGCYHGIRPQL